MQVSLSSGNYDIIASGQAFLFSKDKDFRIDVRTDSGFVFSLILNFIESGSGERNLQMKTNDHVITLTCTNFEGAGAGLKDPVKLAVVDGRDLYLIFWSYLEGKGTRSVKYTLFSEKKTEGVNGYGSAEY